MRITQSILVALSLGVFADSDCYADRTFNNDLLENEGWVTIKKNRYARVLQVTRVYSGNKRFKATLSYWTWNSGTSSYEFQSQGKIRGGVIKVDTVTGRWQFAGKVKMGSTRYKLCGYFTNGPSESDSDDRLLMRLSSGEGAGEAEEETADTYLCPLDVDIFQVGDEDPNV